MVSENAYKSKWVQSEVARADRKKKPFFPLLLQGEPWLMIEAAQYVDVKKGSLPTERFYKRLEGIVIKRKSKISEQNAIEQKSKKTKILRSIIEIMIIIAIILLISLVQQGITKRSDITPQTQVLYSTQELTEKVASTLVSSPVPAKDIPVPPASAELGDTWMRPMDGLVMSYIPAGEFQMGSEDGQDNERPVHTVYLDAYWIDQTEVSNAQFSIFVEEVGYQTEAEENGKSWTYLDGEWQDVEGANWLHPQGPNSDIVELSNHPVTHMSWNDAQEYCKWAESRLPTEAEWEKAARGGLEGKTYPWGDEFDGSNLNFCNVNCPFHWRDSNYYDGYVYTSPVASFSQNDYGLYDMIGNLWEWTLDWYDENYYEISPTSNPMGADTGDYKVLRGGAWSDTDYNLHVANRYEDAPLVTDSYYGFRCVRSATE